MLGSNAGYLRDLYQYIHDAIGAVMADRYNSKIAAFVGKLNGNTTGYGVTISPDCTLYSCSKEHVDEVPGWREEEDAHKKQISRMGVINFFATVLWQYITKGYKKSQIEIDAKKEAGRGV